MGMLFLPNLYVIWCVLWSVVMLGASVGLHECGHGTFYSSKKLNEILGVIFGSCSFQPFGSYRYAHFQHHQWQGTEKDPTPTPLTPPKPNIFFDWCVKCYIPILYWGGVWWAYFAYKPPHYSFFKKGVEWVVVLLPHALLGWAVPNYTGLCFVSFLLYSVLYENLFTISHHMGLRPQMKQPKYSYAEQMDCARTIPTSKGWVGLNFFYHKEHHLYPQAHWTALPLLHQQLKEHNSLLYGEKETFQRALGRRQGRFHQVLWPKKNN